MTKLLVLYYSTYGHVETLANAVAEGARSAAGTHPAPLHGTRRDNESGSWHGFVRDEPDTTKSTTRRFVNNDASRHTFLHQIRFHSQRPRLFNSPRLHHLELCSEKSLGRRMAWLVSANKHKGYWSQQIHIIR